MYSGPRWWHTSRKERRPGSLYRQQQLLAVIFELTVPQVRRILKRNGAGCFGKLNTRETTIAALLGEAGQ